MLVIRRAKVHYYFILMCFAIDFSMTGAVELPSFSLSKPDFWTITADFPAGLRPSAGLLGDRRPWQG